MSTRLASLKWSLFAHLMTVQKDFEGEKYISNNKCQMIVTNITKNKKITMVF